MKLDSNQDMACKYVIHAMEPKYLSNKYKTAIETAVHSKFIFSFGAFLYFFVYLQEYKMFLEKQQLDMAKCIPWNIILMCTTTQCSRFDHTFQVVLLIEPNAAKWLHF